MKWGFFVKKWKMGGIFVKKWKTGGIFCKSGKWGGGVFCKKWTFFSTQGALRTVSVFFILHFTYLGGCVRTTTHPPRLQACSCQFRRDLWPSDCLWCACVIIAGMQTTPCFRRMKLSRRDGFTFDWTRDAQCTRPVSVRHMPLCVVSSRKIHTCPTGFSVLGTVDRQVRECYYRPISDRTLPAPACGLSRRAIPTSRAASWEITEPNCSVPGDN